MIDPRQHIADILHGSRLWQGWPVDHEDGQAERPCRIYLRARACASRIFGDNQVDAVRAHQSEIAVQREGAAIDQQMMVRQRGRRFGGIDEAEQIMMLWLGGEGFDMHAAERQHNAAGRAVERADSASDVRDMGPAVALPRLPFRAGEDQMGHPRLSCGGGGIGADRGGEGVGRVDEVGELFRLQISRQPLSTAKAPDAHRHRLGTRVSGASSIAQHGAFTAFDKGLRQRARFGRAAKDQDVAHGG